jgi:hypothetical protein
MGAIDKDQLQWRYTGDRNSDNEVCNVLSLDVTFSQYDGQGRLQHVSFDNYYYEGGWQHGMREGVGTQQFQTGECYKGEWHMDKMHGAGTIVYPNGDSFDGQWDDGKRVYGTLIIVTPGTPELPNRKMEYRGPFANSMPGGSFQTASNSLSGPVGELVWEKVGRYYGSVNFSVLGRYTIPTYKVFREGYVRFTLSFLIFSQGRDVLF